MSGQKDQTEFTLTPDIVSRPDFLRLINELEQVDNELVAVAVREKTGAHDVKQPVVSDTLGQFLEQNQLDISDSQERTMLIRQLRKLKDDLPVIHMTFATVADRESLREIVSWLRSSIHPQVLVSIGLQPSLVAGVYMRTTNQVHDLSLRKALSDNRGTLTKQLEALRGEG